MIDNPNSHNGMQVCVVHPKAALQPPKKASMYANGHSPGAEEFGQYARFGYDVDAARDYGMPMRVLKRLGQVWQPWYKGMLEQAGLQGVHKLLAFLCCFHAFTTSHCGLSSCF